MELQGQAQKPGASDAGYAMAAMLVGIAAMAILMSVAMPTWRQMVQREKEEELVFRGRQYARAIGLFQRKFAATYPPDVDTLVKQKFLRKKYRDPMVADGEFQVLYQSMQAQLQGPGGARGGRQGQAESRPGTGSRAGGSGTLGTVGSGLAGPRGGVVGVASKSTETSIRLYNGRNHYNEWQFVYVAALAPGGQQRPGMQPGQRGGRGTGPGGPGSGGRGTGPGGPGPGGGRGTGPGGRGPGGVPRGPGN